ncbi:rod-binding protein [Rhizobium sp. TRM95111]|uniref:rod-binding protein n=1 Tax=Rhizobium alarense TaxID=2846851 RepID=UPI001F4419F4|nr:rod-binding protein [Rhizobium alarense]MCF3639549.1 rod-binding protein [Rhizobium alarense]
MAISPPSDLVLDVVRAADPASVQEAQAKLKSNRATFEATSLAEAGSGFNAAVGILSRDSATSSASAETKAVGSKAIPETYRKFEAMVLQNFVKSMLPADSEELYGKGTAGEMWRSMMADQIGDVISRRGGVGIASTLMKDVDLDTSSRGTVTDKGNASNASSAMVQELQRETFADLTPGIDSNKKS